MEKIIGKYMIKFVISLLLTLFSVSVLASTVAVIPVTYVDEATGEQIQSASNKVNQVVKEAIKKAGYSLTEEELIKASIQKESSDGQCDKNCLLKVANSLGADDVILISIKDSNEVSYETKITFAKRDSLIDSRTGGFFVYLEWLKGAVERSLLIPVKSIKQQNEPVKPEIAPIKQEEQSGTPPVTEAATPQSNRKKMGKAPFFVALGISAAMGIATLIIDGAAHKKYKDVDDSLNNPDTPDSEINSNINSIENMHTARNILLTATIAGVVTTGIFAIFTDFKKKKKSDISKKITVQPQIAIQNKEAALFIGGTF